MRSHVSIDGQRVATDDSGRRVNDDVVADGVALRIERPLYDKRSFEGAPAQDDARAAALVRKLRRNGCAFDRRATDPRAA
jgi:hypothetical protein